MSKSLVAPAQCHARSVLDALERLDPERVLPIVGVEPPEVYCLKNDYADLIPSRADEIASRAAQTWLLDEFLLRSDAFQSLRVTKMGGSPAMQGAAPKIQLQPHCHQRAEPPHADGLPTGAAATLALLQSVGFDAEMLDAGCCGMAGTFGYEAEHYELSMKVGEKLFSPLRHYRDTSPKFDGTSVEFGGATGVLREGREGVVCSGAACRMQVAQIAQGAGVEARHPLEAVWSVIGEQ